MRNKNFWRSYGRIVSFQRDLPTLRVIQGVKKDSQAAHDQDPFLHGSNGTYVINEPTFWHLVYVIYNPGPGENRTFTYEADMTNYMVKHFLPERKWYRVSPQRLAAIHEKILNKKLQFMATEYVEEGLFGRDFIPCGYDTWEAFFDDVLKDVR